MPGICNVCFKTLTAYASSFRPPFKSQPLVYAISKRKKEASQAPILTTVRVMSTSHGQSVLPFPRQRLVHSHKTIRPEQTSLQLTVKTASLFTPVDGVGVTGQLCELCATHLREEA